MIHNLKRVGLKPIEYTVREAFFIGAGKPRFSTLGALLLVATQGALVLVPALLSRTALAERLKLKRQEKDKRISCSATSPTLTSLGTLRPLPTSGTSGRSSGPSRS